MHVYKGYSRIDIFVDAVKSHGDDLIHVDNILSVKDDFYFTYFIQTVYDTRIAFIP